MYFTLEHNDDSLCFGTPNPSASNTTIKATRPIHVRCSSNNAHLNTSLVTCVKAVSQHQIDAFTTLVDEVYEAYGTPDGDDKTASRYQAPCSYQRCVAISSHPAQPASASPHPPSRAAQPPISVDAQTARCPCVDAELHPAGGDGGGVCASSRTHGSGHLVESTAGFGMQSWLPPGPATPPFPSTRRHFFEHPQLQTPFTILPTLLLPRRWTDGAAAAAASSMAVASVPASMVAAPIHLSQVPPLAQPVESCRLLELPNELLFLIIMACATPGSTTPGSSVFSWGTSPKRNATVPLAAPNSPGWSFALIASPQASPSRRPTITAAVARSWGAVPPRRWEGRGDRVASSGGAGRGDVGVAGLHAVACAAMTCRRLRGAYRLLLAARPDLELQAEAALRSLYEKRRLVRQLTIHQHNSYVARELAAEGAAGVAVVAAVALLCGSFGACSSSSGGELPVAQLSNYVVFTAVHMLLHTAVLAAAYRTCAWLGIRRSITLGLAGLSAYYLVGVPTAQALLMLPPVPAHLNLEPWHRSAASPSPAYVPAALLWPLYGNGLHWRLIHLFTNGFAWAYGTYEWHHSFSCVRLRNGLRY